MERTLSSPVHTAQNFKGLMLLLATTQLLLIVDASIINVIVPTIAEELRFSETGQSWIANAYLTVFGGALLASGRIADILGRTRIFQAGLLVLAIGSVVSAMASTPEFLIAGRAIQGLGSALSAAASLALILATFEGEQRYKALGLMAAMGGLGGALGTFLGGALTAWLGWRSTFWISVLIPALLLLYSYSVFSKFDKGARRGRADGLGALLLIGGQTLLAWGIVQLGEPSSDTRVLLFAAISGMALLGGFLLRQKAIAHGLIPPATWRNGGLMEALLYAGIGQLVIFPMFFIGNLYLQSILNFSPLVSGSAFLPLCGIVVLTATNAGRCRCPSAGHFPSRPEHGSAARRLPLSRMAGPAARAGASSRSWRACGQRRASSRSPNGPPAEASTATRRRPHRRCAP